LHLVLGRLVKIKARKENMAITKKLGKTSLV